MMMTLMYISSCIRMFNSIEDNNEEDDNNEDDDECRGVYVQLHTIHVSSTYNNKMMMKITRMMMNTEVYMSSCTQYI